jgi:spore coat protein U-like protein
MQGAVRIRGEKWRTADHRANTLSVGEKMARWISAAVLFVLAWVGGAGPADAALHCTLSQSPASILFSPTAWPSSTPATQSFTLTLNCSAATPVNLLFNKNTSNLTLGGTNIPYSLCQTVVANVCNAVPLSMNNLVGSPPLVLTLYGFLASMSTPYAASGTYTDSTIIATTSSGGGVKALNFALNISKSCSVATSALNFGTIPLNATTVKTSLATASTTVSVRCTSTTAYTVGLNQGTGTGATTTTRIMNNGTAHLNYQLWRDLARTLNWGNTVGTDTVSGTGTGLTQNLNVYGSIAAGQSVLPGTYTDTVNVILTY